MKAKKIETVTWLQFIAELGNGKCPTCHLPIARNVRDQRKKSIAGHKIKKGGGEK
jgi:hypothetical protein